jgi:hypothetical protein
MYEECCEGFLDAECKVEENNKLTYWEFREKLGKQLLGYSPTQMKYPGDSLMQAVTSLPKSMRQGADGRRSKNSRGITESQFRAAKRYKTTRLCGNLDKLCMHVKNVVKVPTKKARICAWCGLETYLMCGVCKDETGKPVPLHYNSTKGKAAGAHCFYHYHNDTMIGLGKNDATRLLGKSKSDWEQPRLAEIRDNAEHVANLEYNAE